MVIGWDISTEHLWWVWGHPKKQFVSMFRVWMGITRKLATSKIFKIFGIFADLDSHYIEVDILLHHSPFTGFPTLAILWMKSLHLAMQNYKLWKERLTTLFLRKGTRHVLKFMYNLLYVTFLPQLLLKCLSQCSQLLLYWNTQSGWFLFKNFFRTIYMYIRRHQSSSVFTNRKPELETLIISNIL